MQHGGFAYIFLPRFWGFDSSPPDKYHQGIASVWKRNRPQLSENSREGMLPMTGLPKEPSSVRPVFY
jgi:hypothetical protein